MKRTSFRPNYRKAEKAARDLLKLNKVDALPVYVKKLIHKFDDVKIKTYSWFAEKYNLSHEEVCGIADSDEGCCWYNKPLGKYLILYNENKPPSRIRWTIAHEIGHYSLDHNKITNKAVLSRSSLSDAEYNLYELEANCFARELLAPPAVLRTINIADPQFISNLCNISLEAASNVHNFLISGSRMGIGYPSNNPTRQLFSGFIFNVLNTRICLNCNNKFAAENAKYCTYCGSSRIYKNEKIGSVNMSKNETIQVNQDNIAKVCPRCDNQNIKGLYCHVCGAHLLNKCSGQDMTIDDYYNKDIRWHLVEVGCGEQLDADARFCYKCGSTSTFFEDCLIKAWDAEDSSQVAATNDVSDDQLPF